MNTMAKKRINPWPARLEALQRKLKLTQVELAARLRITQSMISEYRTGKKIPIKAIQYLIELLENETI
jgi:transcriptional regulator with XRE-family HTH domain